LTEMRHAAMAMRNAVGAHASPMCGSTGIPYAVCTKLHQ
jgi:hypothetical protein